MVLAVLMTVAIGACAKKPPPVARPMPPPPAASTGGGRRRRRHRRSRSAEPIVVPPMPAATIRSPARSLDDLNRDSPLKPLFFELDSAEVSAEGQQVLQDNAAI